MSVESQKNEKRKRQFVVYLEDDGLHKCILSAAKSADAIVFRPFKNAFAKILFRLHNTWRMNKRWELPLKFLWYRRCLDERKLDKNAEIVFVFYECFYMTYSRKYLKHLKKKFSNSKFCYVFLNAVNQEKIQKYNAVKEYFDAGVAIFRRDAERYGLLLHEYYCYLPPKVSINSEFDSDVFFVGANKGRLPRLLEVYEKLTAAGIKCDFHITEVDPQDMRYSENIVYNKRMTYEEALQRMNSTKCALEIIQDNDFYFSIRTIEALNFKKKLLTTNKSITDYGFYNPAIIQVFDSVDDINPEFIRSIVSEEKFPNPQPWSFESFEEYLERNLFQK